MEKKDKTYQAYIRILKEELIPAFGCTEPIALAYAGAIAKKHLGCLPDSVQVQVSGNIIKNVKSVVVPNTGGLSGIEVAVSAGIVAGSSERELEVIADITKEDILAMRDFMQKTSIAVELAKSDYIFDICVILKAKADTVKVRIVEEHTNVVLIQKNEDILFQHESDANGKNTLMTDRSILNVEDIVAFADMVDIQDVKDILDRQMEYNMRIAEEGLEGNYGANIGSTLLAMYGDDVKIKARAYAAAGSDARMNGCSLPVVICSGSGNQGDHGFCSGNCVCKRAWYFTGQIISCTCSFKSVYHSSKDRNRQIICVLRSSQCRMRKWSRYCVFIRRRISGNRTYAGQFSCHYFGNHL